ncbi:hypothetical protein DL767_000955 [Monosporascus sp. MG133]|nr:hypothetical protein DL767_000955 [Monosporascus sp. MG133]
MATPERISFDEEGERPYVVAYDQLVTHYAILIGINDYPDQPLESAVRDVQDAKAYLESMLQDAVKIYMVATNHTNGTLSGPVNDSALWPTYENVISVFEQATSLANPGDFVYIHYSGHGTRKPPNGEFSNRSTGDLALVLLHELEDKRVSYLWGYDLARLLKAMVDKGLVITLVLDCCFSASVYRDHDDTGIRFLPYDADSESEYRFDPEESFASAGPAYRDASALPNWLINPDRCAILTACGPHEKAAEPRFNGQRHGALSYYLLEVLKTVGLTKRHSDIYDHIRAKFRGSSLSHQNPVLYGNGNQGFFGRTDKDVTTAAIPVVVTKSGLELQAGHAHGVHDSDQLVLQPLGTDNPDSQELSVVSKVVRIRALTSDLEPLDLPSVRVRTGWMAEPITRFSLQRFPIRLSSELPYRDEWLTALKARSLDVAIEEAPFWVDVVFNNKREYKIMDESGHEVVNLPSMPRDQTSVNQIGDILEHLARFRLVRDLCNKTVADSFRESYDVYIQSGGVKYGPGMRLEVKHGALVELIAKNQGEKVLYVVTKTRRTGQSKEA